MYVTTDGASHNGSIPRAGAPAHERRSARTLQLVVALLAIYGPIALMLVTPYRLTGKIYLVLGAWALEGMLWYWADCRLHPGRESDADAHAWSA